jgi:hypothetical protein
LSFCRDNIKEKPGGDLGPPFAQHPQAPTYSANYYRPCMVIDHPIFCGRLASELIRPSGRRSHSYSIRR